MLKIKSQVKRFDSEHGTCSEYLAIKQLRNLSVGVYLGAFFKDCLILSFGLGANLDLTLNGLVQL